MTMHTIMLTALSLNAEEITKRMDPYFHKIEDSIPLTTEEELEFCDLMTQYESYTAKIDSEWESTPKHEKKAFFNRIYNKLF